MESYPHQPEINPALSGYMLLVLRTNMGNVASVCHTANELGIQIDPGLADYTDKVDELSALEDALANMALELIGRDMASYVEASDSFEAMRDKEIRRSLEHKYLLNPAFKDMLTGLTGANQNALVDLCSILNIVVEDSGTTNEEEVSMRADAVVEYLVSQLE